MAAEERPVRRRSIRAMLAPLFIVPLVSLLALWGFAASVTLLNALREHDFTNENQLYGGQAQILGLRPVAGAIGQVFVWLSSPKAPASQLQHQRQLTNQAMAAFQHGVKAGPAMLMTSARSVPGRLRRRPEQARHHPA